MKLLAIDTSASFCAVAMYDAGNHTILAEKSDDIGRGHAELLMSQIEACLEDASLDYSDINRLGVTMGPGSFTGVRVGMAAGKGLALGLNIPLTGISTLDAVAAYARQQGIADDIGVLIDAKRDQVYGQFPSGEPFISHCDEMGERLTGFTGTLCGSGAREVVERHKLGIAVSHEISTAPIATVARLAAEQPLSEPAPEPLYLRSADAKAQTGFALPRLEPKLC